MIPVALIILVRLFRPLLILLLSVSIVNYYTNASKLNKNKMKSEYKYQF